jgi:hypothetical protein
MSSDRRDLSRTRFGILPSLIEACKYAELSELIVALKQKDQPAYLQAAKACVGRGLPIPYIYKADMELRTPDFPTPQDVAEMIKENSAS